MKGLRNVVIFKRREIEGYSFIWSCMEKSGGATVGWSDPTPL